MQNVINIFILLSGAETNFPAGPVEPVLEARWYRITSTLNYPCLK